MQKFSQIICCLLFLKFGHLGKYLTCLYQRGKSTECVPVKLYSTFVAKWVQDTGLDVFELSPSWVTVDAYRCTEA